MISSNWSSKCDTAPYQLMSIKINQNHLDFYIFFLSNSEKKNELNKIIAFDRTTPTLKCLIIIYEKVKDFSSEINIFGQVINYNIY